MTFFLIFDNFFIFMPSLAGNFLSLPGKQLARLLARLFFSLGSGDSYYNMNARNMKLDNIANEKFKEYMSQQLKTGNNKFPPPWRNLMQIHFPTDELLVGYSIGHCRQRWKAACADSSSRRQR